MEKLVALVLVSLSGAATAQAIGQHPMPDGSADMYLGLGVQSSARYEGAQARHVSALPVLQFEWSSGIFISGMSAGMHLSEQPSMEFGPLLEYQPRRSEDGSGAGAGTVEGFRQGPRIPPPGATLLWNMHEIAPRIEVGGFYNYYLTPRLRVTNSVLLGAGNAHTGARWNLGLQHTAARIGGRHTLALSAGLTLVNSSYNQAFFGVSGDDSISTGLPVYEPGGGLKDLHAGARWNWTFTPSWLMTSTLQASRLAGRATHSPLVERPTNLTVSTALAYRF